MSGFSIIYLLPAGIFWFVYINMTLSALLAYHKGRSRLRGQARWSAGLEVVIALLVLRTGNLPVGLALLAAAWSCWQISGRVCPSLRYRKKMDGPADILDAGL